MLLPGFSFLNPLLAAGIGLIALPVIIHWLSRRQYRLVAWAAMIFLLEAEKENRRRIRFEQWLLLALRCLAVGLLAMVFARPFARPGLLATLLGQQASAQRIIVIDDSASPGCRTAGGVEFDRLKDGARRLCAWLAAERSGDSLTVFVTSQPDAPLIAEPHFSIAKQTQVAEQLAALQGTHARANPPRVLHNVAQAVVAAAPNRTELYIFSDFQRNEWGGGGKGPFAELVSGDSSLLRIVLLHTGPGPRDNIAVTDLRLERPQTLVGLPAVARARVTNYGREAAHNIALRVEVDGAAQSPALVADLAVGQSAEAVFEITLPDEGFHELSVEWPHGDSLRVDDVRRIAIYAAAGLPVLIVNGHPAAEATQDAARLLRAALAPPGPFGSGMIIDVVDAAGLEAADPGRYAVVVLSNFAAPSEVQAAALRRFVDAGGGLVLFLGSEVESEEYNRVLGPGGAGLLPLPLVGLRRERGSGSGVGLIREGAHPLTAMFPGDVDALPEGTRFFNYFLVQTPAEAPASSTANPAQILARFTDEQRSPAIIERSIGRGRVLLFTSSVDLAWNNWARSTDGSFVVSMLEMMQYSARRRSTQPGFPAGEPLRVTLDSESYLPSAVFRTTGEAVEAKNIRNRDEGATIELEGPPAWRCGAYRVELKRRTGAAETWPLCVNLDPSEGDLTVCRAEELDAALGPIRHEYVEVEQSSVGDQEARQEFWPTLLALALAALFGEQLLAWRIGMPGKPARAQR